MSVSYPLSLPSNGVRSVQIGAEATVGMRKSPYTGHRQVYPWAKQEWKASVFLPPMKRAVAEPWIAFLVSLNGREGTFYLGDTANPLPRGTISGNPLVKGGSQSGYDLVIDGLALSATGVLLRGDWLQLGTGSAAQLYKVMADTNSNGAGEATVTLWPRLRSSPADNSTVVYSSPKGVFQLTSNVVDWTIDEAKMYSVSFDAMEVITV